MEMGDGGRGPDPEKAAQPQAGWMRPPPDFAVEVDELCLHHSGAC